MSATSPQAKVTEAQRRALQAAAGGLLRFAATYLSRAPFEFWISGVVPMSKGTVRPATVNALQKRGLLAEHDVSQRDGLLEITDAGRRALAA